MCLKSHLFDSYLKLVSQIHILLAETEDLRANGIQESACVNQSRGSLKQANPELVARKVKGREEGEEHFRQRKGHIWRPEALMQKSGIKANTDFRSHTQVPVWSLRACIF